MAKWTPGKQDLGGAIAPKTLSIPPCVLCVTLNIFWHPRQSSPTILLALSVVVHINQMWLQLQRMHDRGIFHRDISMSNVMLKPPPGEHDPLKVEAHDFQVYIIDFGCAAMASGFDREVSAAFWMTNPIPTVDSRHAVRPQVGVEDMDGWMGGRAPFQQMKLDASGGCERSSRA